MMRHGMWVGTVCACILAATAQAEVQLLPGDGFPGMSGSAGIGLLWDRDGSGARSPVLVLGNRPFFGYVFGIDAVAGALAYVWDGAQWSGVPRPANPGCDALYLLTAWDGRLVFSGQYWDPVTGGPEPRIATYDGTAWVWLGTLPEYSADAIAFEGQLYVLDYGLRRWTGSAWELLGPSLGYSPRLAVHNAALYSSGSDWDTSTHTSTVARWDGAGWTPVGGTFTGDIHALASWNGALYAGGDFTDMDGQPITGLARWDGVTWSPVGDALTYPGGTVKVTALGAYGGYLVVAGDFQYAGSVRADGLALWDGFAWTTIPGRGMTAPRMTLAMEHQGDLWASGWFRRAGGLRAWGLARWDGHDWNAVATVAPPVSVCAVVDDWLYGIIEDVDEDGIPYIQLYRRQEGPWEPVSGRFKGEAPYNDACVGCVAQYRDQLIVGGLFSTVDGAPCPNLAAQVGDTWSPLGGGVGAQGGGVWALREFRGELIVAGGLLTVGDGVAAKNIAAWDGAMWRPLAQGVSDTAKTLVEYRGDLVVGGLFTNAGGAPARQIARWDGAAWHALGNGAWHPAGGEGVVALTITDDYLVVGGDFNHAGTGVANSVARWDGTQWERMDGGITEAWIQDFVQYDGALIAGGSIQLSPTGASVGIARWNGAAWQPYGPDGHAYRLVAYRGRLHMGGGYFTANGRTVYGTAVWGPASLDVTCAGDTDCDGAVTFADIDRFVAALGTPGGIAWAWSCPWANADLNVDGGVTFSDIDPFVARLGHPCE